MQLLSQNLKIHLKCQTQKELWEVSNHSVILEVGNRVRGTSEAEYPGSVRVGSWVQIPTLPFPTRGFPGQALELHLRSERFDSLKEEASTPTPQAVVKGQ